MKAILMSIRPEWVAKILNGEKTIEIRKKFPKYYVGWVYIYCTLGQGLVFDSEGKGLVNSKLFPYAINCPEHNRLINGKVVARFWCDKVEEILPFEEYESPFGMAYKLTKDKIVCCQKAQLTYDEYNHYLKGKKGCAIHISDLEIFDKPKEISEFHWYRKQWVDCGMDCPPYVDEVKYNLTRAPRSWCYIAQ